MKRAESEGQSSFYALQRQRQELEQRIAAALEQLDPDSEMEGTLLRRYTRRWDEPADIPDDEIGRVCRELEEDVPVREFLGDAKYFAWLTAGGKIAMYREALNHMESTIRLSGRAPGDVMTSREFRRYLNHCIQACPLPAVTFEPSPDDPAGDDIDGDTAPAEKTKRFKKPTLEQVTAYCKEKGYTFDPMEFIQYYESVGWKVGKTKKPMANWKSAMWTWAQRENKTEERTVGRGNNIQPVGREVKADIMAQTETYVPVKEREVSV